MLVVERMHVCLSLSICILLILDDWLTRVWRRSQPESNIAWKISKMIPRSVHYLEPNNSFHELTQVESERTNESINAWISLQICKPLGSSSTQQQLQSPRITVFGLNHQEVCSRGSSCGREGNLEFAKILIAFGFVAQVGCSTFRGQVSKHGWYNVMMIQVGCWCWCWYWCLIIARADDLGRHGDPKRRRIGHCPRGIFTRQLRNGRLVSHGWRGRPLGKHVTCIGQFPCLCVQYFYYFASSTTRY